MISWNLVTACLILGVSIHLLLTNDEYDPQNYTIKDGFGGVMLADTTNAGGHVYPYMATIVSVTCLLTLIMIIICFADGFTG